MLRFDRQTLCVLGLVATTGTALPAPGLAQGARPTLTVATKEAPPFALKQPDGTWSGIGIELWRQVATDLDLQYDLVETDLPGLLAGVENGTFDTGIAAVTLTADREAVMDFTHPFHTSGLGIATHAGQNRGWLAVVAHVFSIEFLQIVLGLTALLFLVGWLVWLFERRANPDDFGGSVAAGISSSFWWSAVTMTTVGYGDKAPRTAGGRVVAMLWMFAGLIVISSFTASITTALTVGSLAGAIAGPADLATARVGTVTESTSARYLDDRGLPFTSFTTHRDALDALIARRLDAVVYDAPILRHDVRQSFSATLTVLPGTFEEQAYAIALPPGSLLREPLNRALLARISEPDWQRLLTRYLGQDP